jgi:hypothetical protein
VIQLLGVTISAINITRDLVPIDLAKGILGTIANILNIVQVRLRKPIKPSCMDIIRFIQSVIKNKSDFLAIVNKCETFRRILERATSDASESYLRGSLGEALSELNM